MGSVHITEIIMVPCCLLHIPQVFSNKKITNPFQRPIEKSLLFLHSILHSLTNISLIKTNIKNWCNSFKIAKGKWKKILFLSILNSTNKGNWSISYYFYQTMQEDINITYSTVKMQQLVYCMVLDQFIKWKLKRRNQNIQDKTTF